MRDIRNFHNMTLNKEVLACKDIMEWTEWFRTNDGDRIIQQTKINKDILVSTVFLGIDFSLVGWRPIVFETMIFGGKHDGYQARYSDISEAEKHHHEIVAKLLDGSEIEEWGDGE